MKQEQDYSYQLQVTGPNGFYRAFTGNEKDPALAVNAAYNTAPANKKVLTGHIDVVVAFTESGTAHTIEITDNAYGNKPLLMTRPAGKKTGRLTIDLSKSHGWYDFTIRVKGNNVFCKAVCRSRRNR